MSRLQTSSQALQKKISRVCLLSIIGLIINLTSVAAQSPTITQRTEGWCSPAVGQTGGNVTIVCHGVSPKALERLNELLDKKDLELQAKIEEAELWAQKYRELQDRLAKEARNDVLAQTAKALVEDGKLEEAGVILDRLLASGERMVEQVASDHFNRAEVYALQFQPQNALPHYEKAYRYRPDNRQYGFQYAYILHKQNHYRRAQAVYWDVLNAYRKLAEINPQAYLPDVAGSLNNLGLLYRDTQQLQQSEKVYQEALDIWRKLAETNPQAYLPEVAMTLNNLGMVYNDTQRLQQAEQAFQETLGIYRKLTETNSQTYLPGLANALNTLGVIYRDTQRWQQAEQVFQEALDIRRKLAETNLQAYLPDVAGSLNNLGILYSDTQRWQQGAQAFQEALDIRRKLAETNPQAYLPDVAGSLNSLSILRSKQDDINQAHIFISEALTIQRNLWKQHAMAYGNALANSLRVEVMLLLNSETDTFSVCSQLTEIQNVAVSESLKQWANDRESWLCEKAEGEKRIGKP